MNARIDQLVKSLLQKDSLEQCSLYEVEQFAERYPYFGAAQLLLTKKLQTEDAGRYAAQLQKTYLFFHNPLWVEQLLNETGSAFAYKKTTSAPVSFTPVPENPVQQNGGLTESIAAEIATTAAPPATPAELPAQMENEPPENAESTTTISAITETTPPATVDLVVAEPETAVTAEITTPSAEQAVAPQETEPFNPGMPEAITGKDDLLFEPYHTVDYFASQGIKALEEENPKDKFTQQLKSFTGWLKTLKKQPPVDVNRVPVTLGEHKVEQLAQHSLQEGDIVTEAMAEVWEKQGNNAKAIEIYRKLSLLEPGKSVYFAAKIEDLKKLN